MNIKKFHHALSILQFILRHPNCSNPFIREQFHVLPSSREERSLYFLLASFIKDGLVKKVKVKKMRYGAARNLLSITDKGMQQLDDIERLFSKSISGKNVLNKTEIYDRLQEKVSSIIISGLKEHMPEELAKKVAPDITWKIGDAVSSLFGNIDFTQK